MDKDGTWGSAIEIACAFHLFNVPLYVYDVSHENHTWTAYFHPTLTEFYIEMCVLLYIITATILMLYLQ